MRKILFTSVVAMVFIIALAGCDQAEKAAKGIDLGSTAQVTKLISSATKALGGISDVDSAKAALPALKDVDLDLGKLMEKVKDMSPEQKSKLTGLVSAAMPQLEGTIGKILSLPGVGNVVGPTMNSLQDKFKSLM